MEKIYLRRIFKNISEENIFKQMLSSSPGKAVQCYEGIQRA